jgi:O-antigen biosynthesis protein
VKIVYVVPGIAPAGGIRVIFEHCNRLFARGHEVTVVSMGSTSQPPWFPLKVPICSLASWRGQCDVLVATSVETYAPVKYSTRAVRKWYLMQMRESYFRMMDREWWDKAEGTYADHSVPIYTISQWGADFLKKEHGWKDVPIIRNGVNRQHFYPDLDVKHGRHIWLLCEGHQYNSAKDTEGITWKTAIELKKKYPDTVRIAGYSVVAHRFQSSFDQWVLSPSCEQLRCLYCRSYMLIKATKYDFLSCSPVEAMACGVPTVRGIIEGDDDLIEGYNSLRCGYDLEEMVGTADRLLGDHTLYLKLVSGCLEYTEQSLGWDDKVDAIENLYRG